MKRTFFQTGKKAQTQKYSMDQSQRVETCFSGAQWMWCHAILFLFFFFDLRFGTLSSCLARLFPSAARSQLSVCVSVCVRVWDPMLVTAASCFC